MPQTTYRVFVTTTAELDKRTSLIRTQVRATSSKLKKLEHHLREAMKSVKSWACFRPRDPFKGKSKELDKRIALWTKQFNSSFKLLLLGPAGAGKTTILKQMKIIHFEGFTSEERQQKAKEIRTNLLESVRVIIHDRRLLDNRTFHPSVHLC